MIVRTTTRDLRVRAMYPSEAEHRAIGLYWDDTGEIVLDPTLAPERQAPILLHEIIHAIWAHRKMPKRVTEESACTHLGVALAEIIRDNPEIMAALGLALTEGVPII